MGLFTKKPGGTFFGNLLRKVSNTVSGGLLGNGQNMIPATNVAGSLPVPSTANLQAANDALTAQIAAFKSGQALDLSSVIKLPELNVAPDKSTKTIVIVGIAALLFALLFNKRR